MYRFETLIVNLSLTDADVPLIRSAGLIAKLACSDSVTFLYSREPVEIPESLKTQYPWMMEPIGLASEKRARGFIDAHFDQSLNCKIEISIEEKAPIIALLERAVKSSADLIMTGGDKTDRSLAVKLARKAPCSVLVVPPASSGSISKICMGVDLSHYSEYILDVATAFASANELAEIDCVSFFEVPAGYHKTHLPRSQFEADLKEHTTRSIERFLSRQNLRGVKVSPVVAESPFPGPRLLEFARDDGHDLIIVGCRGKDALTATLLGSNAEETLAGSERAAVLAVKKKGTGLSFVESLLGLKSAGNLF